MPKVAFFTLGCKVNQADTASMEKLFLQAGYDLVAFEDVADVYVINTCVVTNVAQSKSRQIIRRAIKKNPSAVIAVAGCYPQTNAKEAKDIEGVDLLIGNDQRHRIVEFVEKVQQSGYVDAVRSFTKNVEFEELLAGNVDNRTRAFLKVQEGCNQFCTFCIIPYARGPLRSRSIDSIRSEAKRLASLGFKEIVLIGIHLGAYGSEKKDGYKLTDAVKAVLSVPEIARIRLGSLESIEIDDELLSMMVEQERICRHLHLPLQSGCNDILKRMNRPYSVEDFSELAEKIKKIIPDIAITTDVIVGFPGETKEMFQETCDFVKKMNFSKVHVFPFSVRKGTPAEKFSQQIEAKEKDLRAKELIRISDNNKKEILKGFIEKYEQVLFEQIDTETGLMSGMTKGYFKVFAKSNEEFLGQIKTVKINSLYKEDLFGEIIE